MRIVFVRFKTFDVLNCCVDVVCLIVCDVIVFAFVLVLLCCVLVRVWRRLLCVAIHVACVLRECVGIVLCAGVCVCCFTCLDFLCVCLGLLSMLMFVCVCLLCSCDLLLSLCRVLLCFVMMCSVPWVALQCVFALLV